MRNFIRKLFYTVLVVGAVSFVLAKRFGGNITFGSSDADHSTTYEDFSNLSAEGEPFNQVNLHGNFNVVIRDASTHSYSVDARANDTEDIQAYISEDVLYIQHKGKKWFHSGKRDRIEIEISSPELERIEAHGAVKLVSDNTLDGERLEIHMSGASEGDLTLAFRDLELRASGASDIELAGEVDNVELRVSGAGEIDAQDLESASVTVSISGAGEAKVHAKERLEVNVSGAGSVRYKGSPEEISQHVSGAGSVKKMN